MLFTYEFPPMGGIASVRIVKLMKFLPGYGWEPCIVTTRDAPTNIPDEKLLKELPQEPDVYRSYSLEPTRLVRWMKRLRRERRGEGQAGDDSGEVVHSYTGLPFESLVKLKGLLVPDEKIGWFPFALYSAFKALREKDVEIIFSTGPPFTTHIIALAFKAFTGLPWVCEFRDPWVGHHFFKALTPLHAWLAGKMERAAIMRADAVVCSSPGMADAFRADYPRVDRGHFMVITNGFDPEDFPAETRLDKEFTITWLGSVYGDRFPGNLLRAVRDLIEEGEVSRGDVKINFVGTMDQESRGEIAAMGMEDVIETVGFVDHLESIGRICGAHLLLMQLAEGEESETIYPGKMFEYLGTRRPILALVGEGVTADLIRELGVGTVVGPDDLQGIRGAVLRYYSLYKSTGIPAVDNPDVLERFDRERTVRVLAELFDELSG